MAFTAGLKYRHIGLNNPAATDKIKQRKLLFPDSPVAGVYDSTNTSTRLILYNIASRDEDEGSKLRADATFERISTPDPERHFDYAYIKQRYFADKTSQDAPLRPNKNSDSSLAPRREPRPPSSTNQNQRPASKQQSGARVPPRSSSDRHRTCQVSNAPVYTSLEEVGREAQVRQMRRQVMHSQPASRYLHYLAHISSTYDLTPCRRLLQAHFLRLLLNQAEQGRYSEKSCSTYEGQISRSLAVTNKSRDSRRPITAPSSRTKQPASAAAAATKSRPKSSKGQRSSKRVAVVAKSGSSSSVNSWHSAEHLNSYATDDDDDDSVTWNEDDVEIGQHLQQQSDAFNKMNKISLLRQLTASVDSELHSTSDDTELSTGRNTSTRIHSNQHQPHNNDVRTDTETEHVIDNSQQHGEDGSELNSSDCELNCSNRHLQQNSENVDNSAAAEIDGYIIDGATTVISRSHSLSDVNSLNTITSTTSSATTRLRKNGKLLQHRPNSNASKNKTGGLKRTTTDKHTHKTRNTS